MDSSPTSLAGGELGPTPRAPRSRYFPVQTPEEIRASTAAAVAQVKAEEARRQARSETLREARARARAGLKVRQTRLSEAGLAVIAATGPFGLSRQAARRRLKNLRMVDARRLLGWRTVGRVAKDLHIEPRRLSAILEGRADLYVREARRLAVLLDVPLAELLGALEPRVE